MKRPSKTKVACAGGAGAGKTKASAKGKKAGKAPMKKPRDQFPPPFSVPLKEHQPIDFAELRKKMARRQAPAGENKKELVRIIKSLKGQKIKVEEFISLVSTFTADQGECFRSVLGEELDSFRKLARKIYETMTSDVSDVLVNEHIQITSFYEERRQMMHEKMMKMINEIHEMAPEFNFGKFMSGRQDYLNALMPLPEEVQKSGEEIEMHRRQQAYHRLQWLRMEGERLGEENRRLKSKLDDLKREQREEMESAQRVKTEAEAKKTELEEIESTAKETLDKLNESVEKSLIENEAIIRQQEDKVAMELKSMKKTGAIKKTTKKKIKRPAWVSEVAQEMEMQAAQEAIQTEISDAANRRLTRGKQQQSTSGQTSPFHYSPPRPPQGAACPSGACGPPTGPFQFPPPPEMITTPQVLETNVQQVTTTVQQQRQTQQMQQQQALQQRRGRPGYAPRDTWGGYY